MLGLSPKDAWLGGLLVISVAAFLAAGGSGRLVNGRALVPCVGFSLAFTFLALMTGLAVLRE
jgi:hypothetical protein